MADTSTDISLRLSVLPEHGDGSIEQALAVMVKGWTKNRCTKGVTARTKWATAGGCYLCLTGTVGTIVYFSNQYSDLWLLGSWQFLSLGVAVVLYNLLARLRFVGPMQSECLPATIRDLDAALHLLIVESNGVPLTLFWLTVLNMLLLWIASETALNSRILWVTLVVTLVVSVAMSVKCLSVRLCMLKWAYQFDERELVKVMRKLLIIRKIGESMDNRRLSEQDMVVCQALLEEEQQKVEEFSLSDPQCKDAPIRTLVLFQTALLLFHDEHLPNTAHDIYKHLHDLQGGDEEGEDSVNIFPSIMMQSGEERREIMKLFWPCPDGRVLKKDFIETIDGRTVNIFFYMVVLFAIVGQIRSVRMAVYLPICSIISAAALAIARRYSKGIGSFFSILVQRNYRIGDLVEVQPHENGASHWKNACRVKRITMLHTFVVKVDEVGGKHTYSNKQMVSSSLQNWSRLQAKCRIILRVSVDTSGLLVGKFRQEIVQYAKDNPREWLPIIPAVNAIECEDKVKEYSFVILHRKSWHELERVLDSKKKLSAHCQSLADNDLRIAHACGNFTVTVP